MNGLKGLVTSKKGLGFVLLILVGATLQALGRWSEEWRVYSMVLYGIYVGGETANGVTAMMTAAKRGDASAH